MRIVEMVKQVSYVAVENQVPVSSIDLRQLLTNAVTRYQHDNQINDSVEIVAEPGVTVQTNPEVMEDAIARVLTNAWESYGDEADGERRIILTGTVKDTENSKKELIL